MLSRDEQLRRRLLVSLRFMLHSGHHPNF
uniref:Uncharacterized protein n=1 Tax=Rhizophora mucronata TaxID=61149 RepID=A0A2P2NCM4_RHIMU